MVTIRTESKPLTLHNQPLPRNWRDLVAPDPHRPGDGRARLAEHGIAVWAIVGYLHALGDAITPETFAKTADDYQSR